MTRVWVPLKTICGFHLNNRWIVHKIIVSKILVGPLLKVEVEDKNRTLADPLLEPRSKEALTFPSQASSSMGGKGAPLLHRGRFFPRARLLRAHCSMPPHSLVASSSPSRHRAGLQLTERPASLAHARPSLAHIAPTPDLHHQRCRHVTPLVGPRLPPCQTSVTPACRIFVAPVPDHRSSSQRGISAVPSG